MIITLRRLAAGIALLASVASQSAPSSAAPSAVIGDGIPPIAQPSPGEAVPIAAAGAVDGRMAREIAAFFGAYPDMPFVIFLPADAVAGRLDAGQAIARMIHQRQQRGIATGTALVDGARCGPSCAVVWLQGRPRAAGDTATIAVGAARALVGDGATLIVDHPKLQGELAAYLDRQIRVSDPTWPGVTTTAGYAASALYLYPSDLKLRVAAALVSPPSPIQVDDPPQLAPRTSVGAQIWARTDVNGVTFFAVD